MPHGTLALAASLAAMSPAELRELLGRRRVASPRSVQDPLSLAIELLRAESVSSALQSLSRAELSLLQRLGDPRAPEILAKEDLDVLASLRLRGLVGLSAAGDGSSNASTANTDSANADAQGAGSAASALPEVSAALERCSLDDLAAGFGADLTGFGPAPLDARDPSGGSSPDEGPTARDDTSAWFGAALASVARAAALLRTLEHRPARLSRRGAVTVTAQRELASATHDDPEHTARLLEALRLSGLVETAAGHGANPLLWPSPAAADWLALPAPERWAALAEAFVAGIPPELEHTIRLQATGSAEEADTAIDVRFVAGPLLDHEFPLLPGALREQAREWAAAAESLGLTVGGRLTPPAILSLDGDRDEVLALARRDLPPPASGVYLQPDLSLIVPGPLDPDDERALTAIADTEQLGAALTMRLSPATLTRALRAGQSVTEIRALLERLSLTGVPQPLDYLLGDLERKQLTGELAESHPPRISRLHARVTDLARQAGRLSPGLTGDSAAGGSPRRANADPRDSDPHHADTHRTGPHSTASHNADELDRLAERVHAAAQQHSTAGDLTRQLELAIRERTPVRVTAVGPDERTFVLLPVSLAGGRLRATDQAAGVERTLPLRAITAVEAA